MTDQPRRTLTNIEVLSINFIQKWNGTYTCLDIRDRDSGTIYHIASSEPLKPDTHPEQDEHE